MAVANERFERLHRIPHHRRTSSIRSGPSRMWAVKRREDVQMAQTPLTMPLSSSARSWSASAVAQAVIPLYDIPAAMTPASLLNHFCREIHSRVAVASAFSLIASQWPVELPRPCTSCSTTLCPQIESRYATTAYLGKKECSDGSGRTVLL